MTISKILLYFSAAKSITFEFIYFHNIEGFSISKADYSIRSIKFRRCNDVEDNSNRKIFDLVDKITSDTSLQSSLKLIKFETRAFMTYQKWNSIHKRLESLGISLEMDDVKNGFLTYEDEIEQYELRKNENMDLDEIGHSNQKRYQARKLFIQLHQTLLKHWVKGYYYNYIAWVLDLWKNIWFH